MSNFDEIRNAQSEGEAPPHFPRMEGCPSCHEQSGFVVVGRQHIHFCIAHRCYWFGMLTPYARPFSESDQEQREAWNEAGLEGFTQVEPWRRGAELIGRTLGEISELAERQKPKT